MNIANVGLLGIFQRVLQNPETGCFRGGTGSCKLDSAIVNVFIVGILSILEILRFRVL